LFWNEQLPGVFRQAGEENYFFVSCRSEGGNTVSWHRYLFVFLKPDGQYLKIIKMSFFSKSLLVKGAFEFLFNWQSY
jgi:hypothetical protein